MVGVRAKDHDDKRQLVLEKAAALFARNGFHKTSIAEISAACKASKAWVYHYYPTKEDILFTLLREFLEMILARVTAVVEEAKTPKAKFRAFVGECFKIYSQYRINYPILFSEINFLPKAQQTEIRTAERQYAAVLRDIVLALNPKVGAQKEKLMPLTMLIFGALNWTYTWHDPDGALTLDELVDLTEKLLVDGLRSMK